MTLANVPSLGTLFNMAFGRGRTLGRREAEV